MLDRALRLAGYLGCILAAVAIILLANERGLGRNYASYDLFAYVSAARRLVVGEPLYPQIASSFELGQVGLYLYPPPVALLFVPFLLVPFSVASTIWGIALTAVAVVFAFAIAREVAPARRPLAVAFVLGAFPVLWELAYGNVTLVTCALSLVALRPRGHALTSAGALALAVGLKLLALPVAGYLFLAGRMRTVALAAVLLVLVCAITVPFLIRDWTDWVALLAQLTSGPATDTNMLPAPLRVLPGRLVPLGATAVALAGAAWLARAGRLPPRIAAAIALAVAPFISAFVFFPYLLFALPLVVVLILGDTPAWTRVAGVVAWVLFEFQAVQSAGFPSGAAGVTIVVVAGLSMAMTPRPLAGAEPV